MPHSAGDAGTHPIIHRPGREQFLAEAAKAMALDQSPRHLLVIDLDHFRRANNSFGLAIGDEILRRAAGRIAAGTGTGALLRRIGDDEFAVLLAPAADPATTGRLLLEFLARPYAVQGQCIRLSASIGSAAWPADESSAEALLQAASIALEQAKSTGRDRLLPFAPAMATAARFHQALSNDLRAALALERTQLRRAVVDRQFALHFQPQVTAADGRLTGFEALLRWNHPQRGLLGPMVFIPIAMEIGLMGLLGQWVLRSACRAAAGWPVSADGRPLSVSVNVSPCQLAEGTALLAGIAEALAESGLDPDRLHVEITESSLLGDVGEVLRGIKALGAHLSLDDFGSGYSSLGNLARFPFDEMKLDRSFILALEGDDPGRHPGRHQGGHPGGHPGARMIRAVAGLGLGLGLVVVAEGVETLAQAALVRAAGVSTIQGFLVSRPVPEADVPALIDCLQGPHLKSA